MRGCVIEFAEVSQIKTRRQHTTIRDFLGFFIFFDLDFPALLCVL